MAKVKLTITESNCRRVRMVDEFVYMARLLRGKNMYYSYVMGIDNSIEILRSQNFIVEKDGGNYMVSFSKEKANVWENFISSHLEFEYWNEYLAEDKVIFLFHLADGIKKYEVYNFENDEVLTLCEKLCECKFESLKSMLTGNHFYKKVLGEN